MGCPPLADGVIQLKKKPTEENKKQVLFFRQIPLDLIMYQMMMDSPQIKNATSAIPGTSHRLSALCMASIMEDKSSP